MKVLEINKFFYLRGGSERYVFDLTKILEKHGHSVIHFSMNDPKNFSSLNEEHFIDAVDLSKFSFKDFIKFFYNHDAIKRLKHLINIEKPDIAHLHNIAHQLTPATIKVLKKNNIPVVQTLHDYKLICPNAKLYTEDSICFRCQGGKYYNCLARSCMHGSAAKSFMGMVEMYLNKEILKHYDQIDLFIAPSQFMKDICVKFGIPENKIQVIYNFVDIAKKTSNSKTENYFLYFGRLAPEKGIDTLLRAYAKTKDDTELKIAGEGPEIYELMALSKDLGLESRVDFIGQLAGKRLVNTINNAKAIIIPSRWPENMPYSLLEAMAAGKIVIVSDVGGLGEMIEHKKNGFIVQAGDEKALAQVLNNLNKFNLRTMSQNAVSKIKSLNSEDHYMQIISTFKTAILTLPKHENNV